MVELTEKFWTDLSVVLNDPERRRHFLSSLALGPEAVSMIETWDRDREAGSVGFLETGGGVLGPVWSRIRQRLEPVADLFQGDRVGRYLVLEAIGAGGMGSVYLAFDPELDRKIAIKVLHSKIVSGEGKEAARKRLRAEARALAQLSHPNVVAVFDVGAVEDRLFLAMEFVPGCDAAEWLDSSPRSPEDILKLFGSAGRGLAAAHAAGLVHRDFKPQNVLVSDTGRVQVADFGLACVSPESLNAVVSESEANSDRLTQTGAVLGTPAYMAPEQLAGRAVDASSDQFTFCVSLWESLFGERPYAGSDFRELAESYRMGRLEIPAVPRGVPSGVRRALEKGLSIAPEGRYVSMDSLLADLDEFSRRRRRRRLGLAALGVASAGVGLLLALTGSRSAPLCEGPQNELIGVWDESTKSDVTSAFLATDQSFAVDSWRAVEGFLDSYSQRWTEQRIEACEATHIRGDQSTGLMDLRIACLESRKSEFRALTDLFSQADAAIVRKSVDAVWTLSSLEECEDGAALTARGPLPPDPTERVLVQSLQKRQAQAKVLFDVGRYDEASKELTAIVEDARSADYLPLDAELLFLRARLSSQLSHFEDAVDFAQGALALAIEARDDRLAGEVASLLIFVEGFRRGEYEKGHEWARLALAWADRTDSHGVERALLLNRQALVFQEQGNRDKAQSTAQEALGLARSVMSADDPRLAAYLGTAANQLWVAGELDKALELYLQARDQWIAVRGRSHPEMLSLLVGLGSLYDGLSQPKQADQMLREALELAISVYGQEHQQTGLVLTNLGNATLRAGDYDEALDAYTQAVGIYEAVLGNDNVALVYPLGGMGEALLGLGRAGEALVPLEREHRLLEAHPTRSGLMGLCKLLIAKAVLETDRDIGRVKRLLEEARPDLVESGVQGEWYLRELDELSSSLSEGT